MSGNSGSTAAARSPTSSRGVRRHARTHKLLSENPERYDDAAVHGIRELLGSRRARRFPTARSTP
jgi:N-methylhydantoinase A/oxoprolinase/acetone carboxylase beta subunit